MSHKAIDWFCNRVWSRVDPQEHIFHVQFDITNACNLKCTHCYLNDHDDSQTLTFDEWSIILEQFGAFVKKLHMTPSIVLSGGEPLLSPFLFEMIEKIRAQFPECRISVTSNGLLINKEHAKQFKKHGIFVQISADGPDAKRYDLYRGRGNFDKMIAGCDILHKYDVPFYHLAILSRQTSKWIEDFFQLPKRTHAQAMNFMRFVATGEGANLESSEQDGMLGADELKDAYVRILNASRKTGIDTATHDSLWHLIDKNLGSPCNIGFSGFVIGNTGEFKASSRFDHSLGNVMNEDMETIFFNHPILKDLRAGKIEICSDCRYFKRCRGDRNMSYATFGHFLGPDKGCWYQFSRK